jgi:hypothetical protein
MDLNGVTLVGCRIMDYTTIRRMRAVVRYAVGRTEVAPLNRDSSGVKAKNKHLPTTPKSHLEKAFPASQPSFLCSNKFGTDMASLRGHGKSALYSAVSASHGVGDVSGSLI